MINPNGSLQLNGITDPELVRILEIKIRHEGSLLFNPQQMQGAGVNISGKVHPTYNSVILGWSSEKGLEAVQKVVHMLLKREEKATAQSQ
jgi:hypothetical protein